MSKDLLSDVTGKVKAGAEVVERFVDDAGSALSRLRTGVENLIQLARSPKAAPPGAGENARQALDEFDTALAGLTSLGEQLRATATRAEAGPASESEGGSEGQSQGVVPTDIVTDEEGGDGEKGQPQAQGILVSDGAQQGQPVVQAPEEAGDRTEGDDGSILLDEKD